MMFWTFPNYNRVPIPFNGEVLNLTENIREILTRYTKLTEYKIILEAK